MCKTINKVLAVDGQDGNGLELEKVGQLFQLLSLRLKNSYGLSFPQKFT